MLNSNNLSNVEIILLELIKEKNEISGYEIKKQIEDRGYVSWANIGKTSIYSGIRKLDAKKLITLKTVKKKSGKGPLPQHIKLTKSGEKALSCEIKRALLSQRDFPLYYIGIAGIHLLERELILDILEERKEMSFENIIRINKIFEEKGGEHLPIQAKALFEHPILLMKTDIKFIDNLIKTLKEVEK